jgi:hypothetical protein
VSPNFPDPGLAGWGHAYHRANHPALRAIKASYDPDAVFGAKQPPLSR